MKDELLGPICSVLTSFFWAFALVLFKPCGDHMSPVVLNLFKNVVALALLCVTLVFVPEEWEIVRNLPGEDICILLLSGVIGIALADTIFFYSLNLTGVGISVIVNCLYSPLVIMCSWLVLSETLTWSIFVGAALILSGVIVASGVAPPRDRTRRQVVMGMFLGALAMALMAYGISIAKLVFDYDNFPLVWASTLRIVAGTTILGAMAAASPRRRELFSVFRPSAVWKYALPGSILGGYLSMILWVAGFKYTAQAAVSGILNQTTTIFAIILATVFLKEPFGKRKLVAVILALGGVIFVTLKPI